MKISNFILSFCGFCIFYICNADWIDEWYEKIIEEFLGTDYEEVAPFISSVTAGTAEFDKLVEELSKSKRRWLPSLTTAVSVLFACSASVLFYQYVFPNKVHLFVVTALQVLQSCLCPRITTSKSKEEIHKLVSDFVEKKFRNLYWSKEGDDVPVKLLWKGGSLVESSIHCNVRNDESTESKIQQIQKHLLQSRFLFKSPELGSGDEKVVELSPSSSGESTTMKMVKIRKLLESEPEIMHRFVDKGAGTTDDDNAKAGHSKHLQKTTPSTMGFPRMSTKVPQGSVAGCVVPEEGRVENQTVNDKVEKCSKGNPKPESKESPTSDESPDPKLMNRIRLLESRLRLEELKNKNWINRMSRAEGILQQLNKQVERIEETRPMETLTETLKITSTVTNWAPSCHPRRNMQFTLVNQYPPFYLPTPYTSLSEIIKREMCLPSTVESRKNLHYIPPTPQIPALPSPGILPQSSFLSKFLSR